MLIYVNQGRVRSIGLHRTYSQMQAVTITIRFNDTVTWHYWHSRDKRLLHFVTYGGDTLEVPGLPPNGQPLDLVRDCLTVGQKAWLSRWMNS